MSACVPGLAIALAIIGAFNIGCLIGYLSGALCDHRPAAQPGTEGA